MTPRTRTPAVVEDVDWLASWGEWPDRAAARIGRTPDELIAVCQRAGRGDLVAYLAPAAARAHRMEVDPS